MKKPKDKAEMAKGAVPYEVPPGGSMGLLALGAEGIRAWRKSREAYYEKHPDQKPNYEQEWEEAKKKEDERKA